MNSEHDPHGPADPASAGADLDLAPYLDRRVAPARRRQALRRAFLSERYDRCDGLDDYTEAAGRRV